MDFRVRSRLQCLCTRHRDGRARTCRGGGRFIPAASNDNAPSARNSAVEVGGLGDCQPSLISNSLTLNDFEPAKMAFAVPVYLHSHFDILYRGGYIKIDAYASAFVHLELTGLERLQDVNP